MKGTSTGSSKTAKGVKHRRGSRGLSINGQEILGSLLDAEAVSDESDEDGEEDGLNHRMKAIAGKFTAVMVKKRSRDTQDEVK